MFEFRPIDDRDPIAFYRELESEIRGLVGGGNPWYTDLANSSAAIMAHLRRLNWAGFYLARGTELHLGPFQGLPACLSISFSRGVCGAAARERRTMRVEDVHAFPGHIACDARSRSELVVPMIREDRVLGVLDLDSPEVNRFSEADQKGLESIVKLLVEQISWPDRF